MTTAFAYTNVTIVPLRLEPNHRSEQTSQLLFGEKVQITEINNKEWAKVICLFDGYTGWCKQYQLTEITKKEYLKDTKYIVSSNSSKVQFNEGNLWLPMGSELIRFKSGEICIKNENGKFKGEKQAIKEIEQNAETLMQAIMQYMYAPYQWGGRSVAGIDCSGFTQMVYKLLNFHLPRDASKQALEGSVVDFLQNGKLGDLAFFEDKDGKIVHTGILLDDRTIIHASDTSGCVITDRIDQGGIISLLLKRRTHSLRVVKRVINL